MTGPISIIFTAVNTIEYSSSDTITVVIEEDESPEWEHLLNIEMSRFLPQIDLGYRLADRCDDDLTISGNLIFGVETEATILNIVIDPLTNVFLELQDTSFVDTTITITFSAEDEHYNISSSNTVTVTVINGFAPQWSSTPLISFGNDTTYLLSLIHI